MAQGSNPGDTSNRGFASMDPEKQREIASKGGQASGGNFANDPERAAEAGRKGGENSGGNFRNDPERAAEAGRKGGEHSHAGGGQQGAQQGGERGGAGPGRRGRPQGWPAEPRGRRRALIARRGRGRVRRTGGPARLGPSTAPPRRRGAGPVRPSIARQPAAPLTPTRSPSCPQNPVTVP